MMWIVLCSQRKHCSQDGAVAEMLNGSELQPIAILLISCHDACGLYDDVIQPYDCLYFIMRACLPGWNLS